MPKENSEVDNEDDILAVAEELSADLAASDEEVIDESAADEADEEETADDSEETSEEEETADESEEDADEVDEGERTAAGQEKPHDKDVDPETGEGAPKSREEDEESDEAVEEEAADDDAAEEAELDTPKEDIEPQENELESRVAELEEENIRLRKALHRNLVERVVDTKVALGIIVSDDRAEEVAEHESRSAGSLADSLRDLAKMEPRTVVNNNSVPEIDNEAEVVGNEGNVTTMDDEDAATAEESTSPEAVFEDLVVDVLMGRKKA